MFAPEKDEMGYSKYYIIKILLNYPWKWLWLFSYDKEGKAYEQDFGGESYSQRIRELIHETSITLTQGKDFTHRVSKKLLFSLENF
jgi:hypothetical protein